MDGERIEDSAIAVRGIRELLGDIENLVYDDQGGSFTSMYMCKYS